MSDRTLSESETKDGPRGGRPSEHIGPYKILQKVGEGGFGAVFEADQEHPVKRRVALKVIKLGMDTHKVIARFEAERQALAMLDHPHIARVLDAGATEAGRPYFVMELVKGDPISSYCDKHKLSIIERLKLFDQVCAAVQHAHTKGIIHRDIKPSNVLVSTQDDQPFAKVIDFGIAKATSSRLTDMTLFTEHHQMMGTPLYMSPEQAEGSADIDTRTDIYSLGVLLYELLTGTTPLESTSLRAATFAAVQRIIREVEPPRPSARLSQSVATLAGVAALRRMEPRKLTGLVRGELDWIAMKAIEKDRARRYETANALAMDVRRYLAGEPVLAAPPSASYRLRKLVRRHKGAVAAGLLLATALLVGIAGFAWQARRIGIERDAAVAARKKSDAINQFIQTVLQSSDPNKGGAQGMLVTDAMLKAVTQLDEGAFKAQPEVEAGLRLTIAEILDGNGRSSEALPMAERALAIHGQLHSVDHGDVVASLHTLATVRQRLGRAAGAEPLLVQALEMGQRLYKGDHADVATSLSLLAGVRSDLGRAAEAEPLYRQALAMNQRLFKGDHSNVASSLSRLANALESLGRFAEAEPLAVQALEMRQRLYKGDHPEVANSLSSLAYLLESLGRFAEAEPLCVQTLEMNQRLFKGDHPRVATSLNNLASVLDSLGRFAEAESLYVQALEMHQRLFGGDHPMVAVGLNNLAHIRRALGRFAEAEPLYLQALQMNQRLFKGDHPRVAMSLNSLASTLESMARAAEAEPLAAQALGMNHRLFKGDHPEVASSLSSLAKCRMALGRAAEAEPLAAQALEMNERLFKGDHSTVADSRSDLARVRQGLGKTAEARELFDGALAMLRRLTPGPKGSPLLARVLWRSASARLDGRDAASALAELEEAAAMGEELLPPKHPYVKEYRETLAKCRKVLGK